jgi:hypothetical protein
MQVKVTFQVNTETGEIEFFQVDDLGQTRRIANHDAVHDDIARAIARVIDPRADVSEIIDPRRQAAPAQALPAAPATQRQGQQLDQGSAG